MHHNLKEFFMKIIKYIALELKAKKVGSLYAIRNKTKAFDLLEMLNYLFFEYTRTDFDLIIQNLEIIDEEHDDEIIMHGNSRTLCLDLENPDNFYICPMTDYLEFEKSLATSRQKSSFVQYILQHQLDLFKIDRKVFLKLLQDWHMILQNKPQSIVLYQDKVNYVEFVSFESKEQADQFIQKNTK